MAGKMRTVERGCLSAEAPSVKEAKEKLEAAIDAALKGYYYPKTVTWGTYTAFCYRTPHGWTYKLLPHNPEKTGVQDAAGCMGEVPTLEECVQSAAFHVLDIGTADPDYFHKDEDIPAFLTDKDKRSTVLSNARFRRAYLWAKANKPEGVGEGPEHLIHRWACDHANDDQFR